MSGIFDQIINYSPPTTISGGVDYKGTWNASTNSPTLLNPPSSSTKGFYYVVDTAGTQFSISFAVGDWIISNGTSWEKVDLTDAVSSVFGRTGAVVGVSTDYSAVGLTNTAIGAANPSTGAFTTVTASSTIAATGAVTGSNLSGTHSGTSSGTNTGDQTITLTGGVTGSGTGSFAATVVTNANLTGGVTSVGNVATVVTNANLTGDVTSVGNATTLTNAPVIAKVLTGYVSGAGTVSATDSILQAIQKLNGNDATNANLTGAVTSVGNATSLGSFTSANLSAALTDETGSGAAVFATSPTLVTPILGTPSSGTLTSCTGLPISTGVSGLGTGIATALAVATGSAGAPVLFNGALGTPTSGTVTNLTGTASINTNGAHNGTVGATTPNTVAATTLSTTGVTTLGTYGSIYELLEKATITASAPSATTNFDLVTQAVQYYTSNSTTNFTLNIRGNSTTTLNSMLAVGQSATFALMISNSTAYYPTAYTIDGTSVTPKWGGGTAPTSGNASSIDVYVLTVIKTASTPTYVVLANQTKYA